MSWNTFLYGNKETGSNKTIGLLSQLSQRIGMLKNISKYMNRTQLNSVINGLFTSKPLYCLPLFCNVWGISDMDDTDRRFSAFTKEDMRRLQVLQNRVLRLKCHNHNLDINTPTTYLLQLCGDLSVNQLGAYYTILQVFKTIHSGQPKYLAERLKLRKQDEESIFPRRHDNTLQIRGQLSISRSGFLYRGAQLWNALPQDIRRINKLNVFRRELRSWVSLRVPVKPR